MLNGINRGNSHYQRLEKRSSTPSSFSRIEILVGVLLSEKNPILIVWNTFSNIALNARFSAARVFVISHFDFL